MSGIVAIVNFDGTPVDPQVLKKMAEQCAYRGPDGIRYWIQGNVGMAHLALHATQEALRELMPMTSADGSLCLTADARVDNRPELMELLNAKGSPFPSEPTDADLILAAYQAFGEACPQHIIGDYAFAIWDASRQHLFCARDVYGVKSLHYSRAGDTLCVASEAQQIIQHPAFPPRLDEIAVADFLVRNYNDEGHSMFQDVWMVRRAHSLLGDVAGQRMQRYWDIDPNFRITYETDAEYAAHFLKIFERAVADRLRTPNGTSIGITMSGGMDSTSVAAVAQKIINSQSGQPPLLACSYAFETLKECDETYYSQAVADKSGIELIYVQAENFWFLDNDDTYTPSLETPFMAMESLTKHILDIFAKRDIRVWFTGHGGDSLLVGSHLYYADSLAHGKLGGLWEIFKYWKQLDIPFLNLMLAYRDWFLRPLIPEILRKTVRKMRKSEVPDWMDVNFINRTQIIERLSKSKIQRRFSFERARKAIYNSAVFIDPIQMTINWSERLGAHFHMEARHPFLDRRLVEYLMALPPKQFMRIGISKFILREAMQGILPDEVRMRLIKTTFNNYVGLGLRYKENIKIRSLFSNSLLSNLNLIYLFKVNYIYEQFISQGKINDLNISLFIIQVELWLKINYQHLQGENHEFL